MSNQEAKKTKSVTEKAYDEVRDKQNWAMQCLYGSAFLLGLCVIYSNLPDRWQVIDKGVFLSINMLQVVALLGYHGFALWASIIHYEAGKIHYPDLIDNAFGTVLTNDHSENYYASEAVKEGAGKLAWNVTENCYFTYTIYKMMKWKVLEKSVLIILFFAVALIFDHNDWIITFFRLTIPIVWIKKTVVFLYALNEFRIQYDRAYFVMTHPSSSNKQLLADSVNILLHYESLKAWLNIPTDSKIHKSQNAYLNSEFEKISQNFKIKKETT